MTKQELDDLSLENIYYILFNEKECYSDEEIKQLNERKNELEKINSEKLQRERIANRPKEFKCPKCDGINSSKNEKCEFCGHIFSENEYYSTTEKDDSDKKSNLSLYIIALLIPIVGIILGIVYVAKNEDSTGKSLIIFSIIFGIIESMILYGLFV